MNLKISGHHLEVTPALREYVVTKIDRIKRCTDKTLSVAVVLSIEKNKEKERRQTARATVHWKGEPITIAQTHEDLYAAIDLLIDLLDDKICRRNEREMKTRRPLVCTRREHITARA